MVLKVWIFLLFRLDFTNNYKLCRYCYLLLNANYTQSIGKASYQQYVRNLRSAGCRTNYYKSSTLARNLNASIGVGIPIYLGKSAKKRIIHR